MKKGQLYPDMTSIRVKYGKRTVEAVILYKNGAQYNVCVPSMKMTFHATESRLTQHIEDAKLLDSPLMKALE